MEPFSGSGFGYWAPWVVMVAILSLLAWLALPALGVGRSFDLFLRKNDQVSWWIVLIALAVALVLLLFIVGKANNTLPFAPQLWAGLLLLFVLFWEPVFLSMGICSLVGLRLPYVEWKAAMLLGVPFGITTVYLLNATSWLTPFNALRPEIANHWILPIYPIPGTILVTAVPVAILILWSVWKRSPMGACFDSWDRWDKAERTFLKWKLKLELKLKRWTS